MSDLAHQADVAVKVYFRRPTAEKKGYISAYTSYPRREGEDWNRGNDLADGGWEQETIDRVKRDIDRVFAQQQAEVGAEAQPTTAQGSPCYGPSISEQREMGVEPS